MTKREFLETIVESAMTEEVKVFAKAEIQKMDEQLEKRREKAAEKKAEYEPILDKIYTDILGDKPVTASMVAERLEMSTQKASAMLRKLVEAGKATAQEVKVEKRKAKGYTRV